MYEALATESGIAAIRGLNRGIEKESLRVAGDGLLARTEHPRALGSALTHRHITTDFSEAQLELITDVFDDAGACLGQLDDIHRFVYSVLDDEILWGASMPCVLRSDDAIPIANFGSSNVGMAKTVYRRGLGHRYGRLMQTISGIHYNFSLPAEFWPWYAATTGRSGDPQTLATEGYFGLIRNFRRHSWLLLYLFGASPAVCKSFLTGRDHELEVFDEGSLYLPHATSLRMGGLGYQSDAQARLQVSYNGLEDYALTLREALTRPYPDYQAMGLEQDGEFKQLSTSLLQIENEFYGTIRPKRSIHPGERALHALCERGVEYVEVRCMDLNPFLPLGIDAETVRFLDAFLLHCLLSDSPEDNPEEIDALRRNQTRIVNRGREDGLTLEDEGTLRDRTQWAEEIIEACTRTAAALDAAHGGDDHARAVAAQLGRIRDPEQTPSARILRAMRDGPVPFFRFAMDASERHARHFRDHPLDPASQSRFQEQSAESLRRQSEIEAADSMDFATYRQQYIEQELLPGRTPATAGTG
ncbi:MAG: glutamate--cysteine ligase [Gammaproteobacteria bacterium]|nr:glutamate--cysteine ligase [Gammaproteobacteria bacterium]